jgi:hypothetical protein
MLMRQFFRIILFLTFFVSICCDAGDLTCPSIDKIQTAQFARVSRLYAWAPEWIVESDVFNNDSTEWKAGVIFTNPDMNTPENALNYLQKQIKVTTLNTPKIEKIDNATACIYLDEEAFFVAAMSNPMGQSLVLRNFYF